jgi:Ca2+/H+ antiporter, TMEM165/GDT1 family
MLKEGLEMQSGTSSVQEEMKEVEQELEEKDFTVPTSPTGGPTTTHPAEALEAGTAWKPKRRTSISQQASGGILNLLNLLFSPVFVQTFVMTFLGEWGDRSQIATITLAAASGLSHCIESTNCRLLVCYFWNCYCTWLLYCCCCDRWSIACK